MRQISNSSRSLDEQISRVLNKIRKPSTAEEITRFAQSRTRSGRWDFPSKGSRGVVADREGHHVDSVLVKDSSPQVAIASGAQAVVPKECKRCDRLRNSSLRSRVGCAQEPLFT
jgi:hypothetical protein